MFIHLLIGQHHPCVPPIGTTALGQELVADTVHGSKMERPTSIFFKLLTESQDVVVDGASAGIVLVTPHLVEQFASRNGTPRVLRQVSQSLEFQARETGSPLRLASMDEKLTFTSPNTNSLSSPLALDGVAPFPINSKNSGVREMSTSELFPVVFTESLLL